MGKFCANCGNKLSENNKFCGNCGKSVNGEKATVGLASLCPKSKIIAGLLGIFLGEFGIHNFYLGNNSRGKTQLLLTVLSFGLLLPFTSIWGIVEGVLILTGIIGTDANGNPLSN